MSKFMVMTLLLVVMTNYPYSQSLKCGFDDYLNHRLKTDPGLIQAIEENESKLYSTHNSLKRSQSALEVTIPVVVHILHTGQATGSITFITDNQVFSAIDHLNRVFGGEKPFLAPSSTIRFALAGRTPDCKPTQGINRVDVSHICMDGDCYKEKGITFKNEKAVKNASRWPASDYLNIWVVQEIENNGASSGIQGFATFPGADPELDGVTILYNAFGYQETFPGAFSLKSETRLNAVLVHEVGHALGLYHSFEGDDYNRDGIGDRCPSHTGCGPYNGDCVADTPPHRRSNGNCPTEGTNVCDGGFSNTLFVHNFMDYSSESCMSEFTSGQVLRMIQTLINLRPGWLHSMGDLAIGSTTKQIASCSPQTRYPNNTFNLGIREFRLGNFVHLSGNTTQDGGYLDHWCSQAVAERGKTYELYISTGEQNVQNVKVFADYNGDGDFADAGEMVFSSVKAKVHQGKVTIPGTAREGVSLRMRVICDYSGFTISNACFQPYYGQVEDYSLYLNKPILDEQPDLPGGLSTDVAGLFTQSEELSFEIFPNPAIEKVYVRSAYPITVGRMEVVNLSGQVLQSSKPAEGPHIEWQLDLDHLETGIYYLRITSDQGVKIQKINLL